MSKRVIECPGTYNGHLQGIALDEDGNIYWSFTVDLVKTDTEGNILKHIPVENHHGDICCEDGILYVAVNLGEFNRKEDLDDNWIYAYNIHDFSLLWKKNIPEVAHGAGGMSMHNRHFYVVGGLPEGYESNYVYEYDSECEFMQRYTLETGYTFKGVQTACCAYDCWWFGCYGEPAKLIKTDLNFGLYGMYVFDCSLGIIDTGDEEFMIGRFRDSHPHQGELVSAIGDETMGLVIG